MGGAGPSAAGVSARNGGVVRAMMQVRVRWRPPRSMNVDNSHVMLNQEGSPSSNCLLIKI